MDRAVVELIAKELTVEDRRSMRLVCRSLHEASRDCFTVAQFLTDTPALRDDALVVFPRMASLAISCDGTEEDLEIQVSRLVSCSPALLSNLTVASLYVVTWSASATQALASRCVKLERLHVHHPHFHATFTGAGPDPAAHLQRQLATPTPTPTFFYPPSWAAHDCLTGLLLFPYKTSDWTTDHPAARNLAHPPSTFPPHPVDFNTNLLRALPNLASLTQLSVDMPGEDDSYYSLLCQALPSLPQLRNLSLDSDEAFYPDLITPIDHPWSALTNLTRLNMSAAYLHIEGLAPLRLLRRLRVALPTGQASALYSLTALTSLSLGEGPSVNSLGPLVIDNLRNGMPQQWRTGMQRLVWMHKETTLDPAALVLLQGLTRLNIGYQTITHELVRALAQLPRLQKLKSYALVPDNHLALRRPPPLPERPALPSLVKLRDRCNSTALLKVLGQWTQLPHSIHRQLQLDLGADPSGTTPPPYDRLRHWSPAWLRALLCSGSAIRGQLQQLRLLFEDQHDVNAFCAAAPAARLGLGSVHLCVAKNMQQAALAKLLATADRVCRAWGLSGPCKSNAEGSSSSRCSAAAGRASEFAPLRLPHAHFVDALPVNGLVNLVDLHVDLTGIGRAAMQALLARAPALETLRLSGDGQGGLTASQLMPCAYSRQLRELRLARLGREYRGEVVQLVADFLLFAADAHPAFTLVWEMSYVPGWMKDFEKRLMGCPLVNGGWTLAVEGREFRAAPKSRGAVTGAGMLEQLRI